MSFNFEWPEFPQEFYDNAVNIVNTALNRGPKPKVIVGDIQVHELNMGTVPPELEILEIGDLSKERFRGIFQLTYAGDAYLVLSTTVQANPLATGGQTDPGLFSSPAASRGMLFAASPLVVPMRVRLSSMKLRAIVVLVVSRSKGITLVFKNDPLEGVHVSSTFDSVGVIQKYLQQEIEGQLREVFREDLPNIIHRLSQQWLRSEASAAPPAHPAQPAPSTPHGGRGEPRPREMRRAESVSSQYPHADAGDLPLSLLALESETLGVPPGVSPSAYAQLARLSAEHSSRGLKDLFNPQAPAQMHAPASAHSTPPRRPPRRANSEASVTSAAAQELHSHARTYYSASRARPPPLASLGATPAHHSGLASPAPSRAPSAESVSTQDVAGRLAELLRSNHTLSPYTRHTEHIAMRTAPGLWTSAAHAAAPRTSRRPARQRRVFHLEKHTAPADAASEGSTSTGEPEPTGSHGSA